MNRIYSLDTYKMIDRERIYAALDQGNRHEANILLKYSSLTRQEFTDILHQHPSFNQKEGFEDEAWRQLLDVISTKVSTSIFDTWFKHTNGIILDDKLTIYCANEFQRAWLEDQYRELIKDVSEELKGKKYAIVFKTKQSS